MKKIILLIIPLLIWGCNKKFDNPIDISNSTFYAASVYPIKTFTYSSADSTLKPQIAVKNSDQVQQVYFNISDPDGMQMNNSPIIMKKGDTFNSADTFTFNGEWPMSQYYAKGKYEIQFFAVDNLGNDVKLAVQYFNFDNSQQNVPPVISNVVAPDTLVMSGQKIVFLVTVDASDANGLNDIKSVFFNSYLPGGLASSQNPFLLLDDGKNGDKVWGDGTYSLIVELPASGVTPGTYRWEFHARDRDDSVSNIIIHELVIK